MMREMKKSHSAAQEEYREQKAVNNTLFRGEWTHTTSSLDAAVLNSAARSHGITRGSSGCFQVPFGQTDSSCARQHWIINSKLFFYINEQYFLSQLLAVVNSQLEAYHNDAWQSSVRLSVRIKQLLVIHSPCISILLICSIAGTGKFQITETNE